MPVDKTIPAVQTRVKPEVVEFRKKK